jgi:hypothetical protein
MVADTTAAVLPVWRVAAAAGAAPGPCLWACVVHGSYK